MNFNVNENELKKELELHNTRIFYYKRISYIQTTIKRLDKAFIYKPYETVLKLDSLSNETLFSLKSYLEQYVDNNKPNLASNFSTLALLIALASLVIPESDIIDKPYIGYTLYFCVVIPIVLFWVNDFYQRYKRGLYLRLLSRLKSYFTYERTQLKK